MGEACSGQGGPETENTPQNATGISPLGSVENVGCDEKCPWGYHHFFLKHFWLVVFRPTPMKNDGVKVSWGYDRQDMESHSKIPWFQSPPSSIDISQRYSPMVLFPNYKWIIIP